MRRAGGHAGRILLGLVFLAAGIMKALDPDEFARQMAGYGLVGGGVAVAMAPLLIGLEIALGACLLLGAWPAPAAVTGAALLAFFIVVEAYGMQHGRTEACGCFGAYVPRTPGQVIAEDLLFIGFAALAIWGLRGWRGLAVPRAAMVLAVSGVLGLGFAYASPALPLDRYLTRLAPGKSLQDLGLDTRFPELAVGRHLVVLIDVLSPAAVEVTDGLNTLAGGPGIPPILAMTPATEEEIAAFGWSAVPAFEVRRVDRDVLKRLYRRLPRFFVLEAGRVTSVLDGAPLRAGDLLSSEAP